jgi:hypothetical protein
MRRRTLSSVSAGQSAASVGTVETTVMPRRESHGPRSIPDFTSERGAGTRQAPWPQASHISSQLASKATERPASTRSSGPSGSSRQKMRPSASTKAAADRWLTATPLGLPVEPEVKITQQSSPGLGARRAGVSASGRSVMRVRVRPSVMTAATPASSHTVRARSSGSSTSTGT